MIEVVRAQWLDVAIDFDRHPRRARDLLAVHLESLAEDLGDTYYRGLAEAVRRAPRIAARIDAQNWN